MTYVTEIIIAKIIIKKKYPSPIASEIRYPMRTKNNNIMNIKITEFRLFRAIWSWKDNLSDIFLRVFVTI